MIRIPNTGGVMLRFGAQVYVWRTGAAFGLFLRTKTEDWCGDGSDYWLAGNPFSMLN